MGFTTFIMKLVCTWEYRSKGHKGGFMLQVSWDYHQALVWHRVRRDSSHLRNITHTSLYTCMHYLAHILPPPNLTEMNRHLVPAKRRLN